jgi:hypothetical protein
MRRASAKGSASSSIPQRRHLAGQAHVNAFSSVHNHTRCTSGTRLRHSTYPPAYALAITLDRAPPALRSTRNRLRTAVRRGASWTAAYHRQLTVAAVARPVGSSVVRALGVLAAARSWWLLAQAALPGGASSRSRAVGRRRRGRPCQQAGHGVGRGVQQAVSTHPGSGVRDPAVQPSGVRSPRVVVQRVRRSAVCCPPVPVSSCLLSTRAVSSRLVSAPSVRTRPSPPMLRRWRWGPGRGGRATVTTGTGGGPCRCRRRVGRWEVAGGHEPPG